MATVSLIIPIYNVELYVDRCLRSVMAQSYSDIECILVDDCTPDGSMSVCDRLLAEYRGPIQFKVLHHDHNRGLSAARNTGTDAATGDYVFYLDSDDAIIPECIEWMVKEMGKHPDTQMVCGSMDSDDRVYCAEQYTIIDDNQAIKLRYLNPKQEFPVPAWNKLIRKDFLNQHNIAFRDGILHEDVLWTFHTIQYLSNVVMLQSPTYCYNIREDSITAKTTSTAARANSLMIIFTEIANTAQEPYYSLCVYKFIERLLEWFPLSTSKNRYVFIAYIRNLLRLKQYKDAAALAVYRAIGCFSRNNSFNTRIQQHFTYRYHYENQQVHSPQ